MEGKDRLEDEGLSDFSDESSHSDSEESQDMKRDGRDSESDFDASFADSDGGDDNHGGSQKRGSQGEQLRVKEVENQPYDAKVDLEESFSDESIDTNDNDFASPKMRAVDSIQTNEPVSPDDRGDSPPRQATSPGMGKGNLSETDEIPGSLGGSEGKQAERQSSPISTSPRNDGDHQRKSTAGVKLEGSEYMQQAARRASAAPAKQHDDDDDDESSMSSSTASRKATKLVGGYDPSQFENLPVSAEVRELFQYVLRYTPHELDLDTRLKPFIPDYIPAVGQIDTFVKIPHPSMEPDYLGLRTLDEPSANQSDATVLDLQLRAISKKSVKNPMLVRSIENANRDKKAVQGWIDSIKDLHRSKPQPTVHYTRQMPDIDLLMQVWPEEVEALMREVKLPEAGIDLDLKDYARVVCAVLDIPVYTSMIESLHVLFTLFTEFKNNQHFQRANLT